MKKRNEDKVKKAVIALALITALSATVIESAAYCVPKDEELSASSRSIVSTGTSDGRRYLTLSGVTNKSLSAYERVSVSIQGKELSVRGFVHGDTYYVPFRAAANALSASYSYDSKTKTSTLRMSGLEIVSSDACFVTYANGRVLFHHSPSVIMSDTRLYIPAHLLAKALGLTLDTSEGISLQGRYSPILSADKFYRDDEVFWLGRIIHAESRGEPLIGQIAVGNVVMNRVRSAYYPNTIYGVIFDRKYGVQFSPILNGEIYNTPSYSSTLAAKICLEGYDLSEGSFFFLHPRLATSSWIPQSREYSFTIGNHDFYK